MKATGIVRRIDDLGRVVIPKEIRRTLRIREGDPLEIFTDREGEVILKKYSPIGELSEFATEYVESLYESLGNLAIITDRDTIIAVAGNSKKEYIDKRVSKQLERLMEEREVSVLNKGDKIVTLTSDESDENKYSAQVIAPIVTHGDPIGAVIICSKEKGTTMGEVEKKIAATAASFLSKQMEQ
ncbi:stage V sporulation protein T [Serpentinicella alkaliphila]|uniref:AbrB family transcriptional regulator n=1 Tax=Serpentinicella alkaliphila TaxID=1734049 RepID=A0A4R2T296_9FIRM|nr:stage V sporulation protein T [Serpentinicella alkaliphila]QUH25077.1 stage V sporulation protein T [Serpentinicella alkaliphila]TCP94924.1 AbrB family transcriptional regulator [Serpentinicella alkaliphila]